MHYEYCTRNGHVKVKMSSGKEKCLEFHDGQYQFTAPFIQYANFESMLKLSDERYREKTNQMKTE